MGSVIDRYGAQKTSLYDFGEAFEIDLSHEFQLYTFARSSSDKFSRSSQWENLKKRVGNFVFQNFEIDLSHESYHQISFALNFS